MGTYQWLVLGLHDRVVASLVTIYTLSCSVSFIAYFASWADSVTP